MLAYIRGDITETGDGYIVVECGGVGYLMSVSGATLSNLSGKENVKLHTRMLVREDSVSLIGFASRDESEMFGLLIGVSGVGTKAALSVLSSFTPQQVMLAVLSGDSDAFCRAQGIGKKTAQRLVLELKDRFKAADMDAAAAFEPQERLAAGGTAKNDAIAALTALGYGRGEAVRAVMEVALDGMDAEHIIRLALKKLAG